MRNVAIISDSTSDLSKELLERYGVTTFPLHIHLGDEEFSDGINVTPEQIYKWSDANKATPKTSALSPYEARGCLEQQLATSKEVICFCVSEEMSSCANVMRMAAAELEAENRVYVVDSQNLSTGIGLQIIEAANMAEQGKSAQEIVYYVMRIQPFIRASFVVDTLTYLHRGGRCSGLTALAGSTLKLHPCISVIDGKMQAGKKYRGRMDKAIKEYVADLKPELSNARQERVFITHSGCEQSIIEAVWQELNGMNYFKEILGTRAGSVITSHCGPGTLGVLFIAKEK